MGLSVSWVGKSHQGGAYSCGGIRKKNYIGWGFSSVIELLPSKRKALGSVLSFRKKK